MKSFIFAIGFLLVSALSCSAVISQLYNQNDFSSNYNVINFDDASHGSAANTLYSNQGVYFSNIGSAPVPIYEWTSLPNYQTGEDFRVTSSPDNVIATVCGMNGSLFSNYLDVIFSSGAYQIGAFFGNDQWNYFTQQTLSLFDVSDTFIGTVAVNANVNTSVDQFIGIKSDALFYRARFENDAANSLSVVLDDLTYVSALPVPEPSTIILMGIGLLGLVGIKSRKKKV